MILYLISNRHSLFSEEEAFSDEVAFERLADQAKQAAESDVELFQLREKDLSPRKLLELGKRIKRVLHGSRTRLLVNDRLDVALAVGAHGVHLTANSIGAAEARRVAGPNFLIGVSVHSGDEIAAAEGFADFAVCGPVFETPGKSPIGLEQFNQLASESTLPVFALGGVSPDTLPLIRETQAAGIAGIRLFSHPDLSTEVQRIRQALNDHETYSQHRRTRSGRRRGTVG